MIPIEAVTVCVDYADFLAETAQYNRPLLHRWVVVTTPQDKATQAVCRRFHLETVVTEDTHRRGAFDKGRMIDRGLQMLQGTGWQLHLDADIALPADIQPVLDEAHLDETCVYGCDRFNVKGNESWDAVRAGGLWCRTNPWMVAMSRPQLTIGARVANLNHGWAPIGFFQLWHGYKAYPGRHGTAARTDVQHAYQWDRRKRVFLPELLVWHLESTGKSRMGANWSGRKTPPFREEGIPCVPDASVRESYGTATAS